MTHPELNRKEARQGETLGVMRYVLTISTAAAFLAVVGLAVYFILG